MQYYMNYVLGLPRSSAKKADQGTIVHKVMEVLAQCKKTMQHGKFIKSYNTDAEWWEFNDEHIGVVAWTTEGFLKPYVLSNSEIDAINKTRINKQVYKHDAKIPYGTIHYGVDMVEDIFERAYEYYSKDDWKPVDKKDCRNWTWMATEYKDGMFDPRRRTIVEAEPHFDFIIDKPWAQYNWKLPNGKEISGKLGIKGTIDLITAHPGGIIEIVDWKGLPLDTPIPTPRGWTTMGKLEKGDIVFDESGKPTEVVGKSEVKNKPCYKITFDDTSTAICDNEHLWKLSTGFTYPITKLKIGDKINLAKPLKLPKQDLPIDPYVLGVWLGDGRKRNGEISCNDPPIIDEIIARGYELGKDISSKNNCPQHTIIGLRTQLRKLDLLNNKHIPQIYLRASYKQRLDLLRGLMDSDGNVNPVRKQCVFTNCNKRLSEDTKELLLSLGQRPLISHVLNTQFDKDIDVYPVSFRPIDINPFLLSRKSKAIKEKWEYGYSNYRKIINIETVPSQPTQCIMVNSQTNTYLCTKNMIPTHNTGQRKDWGEKNEKKSEKTYAKLCQDFQLMLYYYAARKLYPDVKQIMVSIMFVRHGGPFTICMDDGVIREVEDRLCSRFQEIAACQLPAMQDATQRDFRCTRICDYYKMVAPNGDNMCKFIHEQIQKMGIDEVTNKYTQEGFSVGTYQAPGEAS